MKNKLILLAMGVALTTQTLLAQIPSYVPTNGLVGYWPFNGNANDLSGNNYDGVALNGAELTTDRFNNSNFAYNFDGVDDFIRTNLPYTVLSNSTGFSGSAWIKLGAIDSYFGQTIVSNFSPSNTQFSFAIVGSENPSNIRHLVLFYKPTNTSGQVIICPTNPIIIDTWTHVAFTISTDFVRFYINGVMVNQQISNFVALGQESSNIPNVKIGQGNPTSGFRQDFNGKLDDIGIWNRALAQQEITNLYNSVNSNECLTMVINTGALSTNPVTYTSTVNIYPNPTNDHITIDCGNITNVQGWSIKITNSLGQEVFNGLMNTQQYYIPLNSWTGQGVYFVKIINAQNEVVNIKKIILQ